MAGIGGGVLALPDSNPGEPNGLGMKPGFPTTPLLAGPGEPPGMPGEGGLGIRTASVVGPGDPPGMPGGGGFGIGSGSLACRGASRIGVNRCAEEAPHAPRDKVAS